MRQLKQWWKSRTRRYSETEFRKYKQEIQEEYEGKYNLFVEKNKYDFDLMVKEFDEKIKEVSERERKVYMPQIEELKIENRRIQDILDGDRQIHNLIKIQRQEFIEVSEDVGHELKLATEAVGIAVKRLNNVIDKISNFSDKQIEYDKKIEKKT